MPTFEVIELYAYEVSYMIEANTWEEAKAKVEQGDPGEGEETPIGSDGVIHVEDVETGEVFFEG